MTTETLKSQDFTILLSNAFGKEKVSDTRKVFEFILNPKSLKREVVDEVKNEIASKDFVRAEIAEAKLELKQEIADTKAELKSDIADLRTELKSDIADLRTELKSDIADIKGEVADLRANMKGFKREVRILAIGLAILIIFFQPFIADLIKGFVFK